MSMTVDQITTIAMDLSVSFRAELAEKLVESLDFSLGDDIQKTWASEAIQRRNEVLSGRVQTISGDQVLAEVRQMLDR